MTSRFVSGGTITGDGAVAEAHINPDEERKDSGSGNNAVEWDAVQKDLEEERRKRDEARKNAVEGGAAGGERSLFEVLQANKGMLLLTYTFTQTHSFGHCPFPLVFRVTLATLPTVDYSQLGVHQSGSKRFRGCLI
jgi:hypothetical protein